MEVAVTVVTRVVGALLILIVMPGHRQIKSSIPRANITSNIDDRIFLEVLVDIYWVKNDVDFSDRASLFAALWSISSWADQSSRMESST